MTGGTMSFYRQVLELFCKDAEERLPVLQNVPEASALTVFITQVHALKSASASIGAAEISGKAAELEAAGKTTNFDFIRENLPGFRSDLEELVGEIQIWQDAVKEQDTPNKENDDMAVMLLLPELLVALETENAGDVDRILEEIMKQTIDAKTKEVVEKISDNVLMTEFESAAEIVRSLLYK
jgi:HPt (histidine-containing phosphotransfer) domain-containing protein